MLKLNFELETAEERKAFLEAYLPTINPTQRELETIGDYLLWGKNNSKIPVELKSKWSQKPEESLDALIESPTFNEVNLFCPPKKIPKIKFNRDEALGKAPEHLVPILIDLFDSIDRDDLLVTYYELRVGKRLKPPRSALLEKFDPAEISEIETRAQNLTQRQYLKIRHTLLENRRLQFTYRDLYLNPIQRHTFDRPQPIDPTELQFYPFTISPDSPLYPIVFPAGALPSPNPAHAPYYQLLKNFKTLETPPLALDLTREEVIYQILNHFPISEIPILKYYFDLTPLTPSQALIFELKTTTKKTNPEIAAIINDTFQKSHNPNYISTVFCRQITRAIAETAQVHQRIIAKLSNAEAEAEAEAEAFKKCTKCGRLLLKDTAFFMRKKKSKDGFNSFCKSCGRLSRGGRR